MSPKQIEKRLSQHVIVISLISDVDVVISFRVIPWNTILIHITETVVVLAVIEYDV
ncbi:MAG: hypothetical protein OEL56_05795 [Nitrosopumilus sp.]|nr:hypothetical protein [Nitrosopumilus sp.]MDH3516016.1 hypothetical protein [Nitrosopumilus sp.]MDH3565653.1 hypothetical protein [Nitrosopumilus sp.]MDH5417277.1 hypothetical protein [Nitrosopumilus sp.]MDH5555559.1 hypothetical protein [Nitrosopumilus sp.]